MGRSQPLTFATLDGLAFAAERGRLDNLPVEPDLIAGDLGPVFEFVLLASAGLLPSPDRVPWLALNGCAAVFSAFSNRRHQWVCPKTRRLGLYRTHGTRPGDESLWIEFCFAAQHAAVAEGFPKAISAQLVAAMGEMQSNIYEHSQASETGLIAFRAAANTFEFVVADRGVGVLRTLRSCPDYADVSDHGKALQLTLTEGVSRHGRGGGRGLGFRPLFTGLANLSGNLRFRSGDHALTIGGRDHPNPRSLPAKLAKKTNLDGFLASVTMSLS